MTSTITKKRDLIEFINKEVDNKGTTDINRAYKLFCKCLSKSIVESYNKFIDLENIDVVESVKSCADLVFHVFWSLLSYTNNLRLTIFLSERAVLLYTEFITMSRNPILNKELKFTPNTNDALIFAYKKTIGPLKINKNKIIDDSTLNNARNASLDMKYILYEITQAVFSNKQIINMENQNKDYFTNEFQKLLDNTIHCISKIILECYSINDSDFNINIYDKFTEIFKQLYSNNTLYNIQLIRIILEFYKKNLNKCTSDIIKNKINILCNSIDHSQFSSGLIIDTFHKNIKKKKIYYEFNA